MEKKKGEVLNQLAIISDLVEKINIKSKNPTILFEVDDDEFERVKSIVKTKSGDEDNNDDGVFTVVMGETNIMFSKNNV